MFNLHQFTITVLQKLDSLWRSSKCLNFSVVSIEFSAKVGKSSCFTNRWIYPPKRDHFKRKFHLPTTIFFRRYVSFRAWSVVKKDTGWRVFQSTLGCLGELWRHDGCENLRKTRKASSFILGNFRSHDTSHRCVFFACFSFQRLYKPFFLLGGVEIRC